MIMQGKEYDPSSVEGLDDLPYAIPSLVIESHQVDVNAPVQWLRSVGHSHAAFAAECFSDELAALGQKDPYQLRRELLVKQPRYLGVLDLAAQKAGWGQPLPHGAGRAGAASAHPADVGRMKRCITPRAATHTLIALLNRLMVSLFYRDGDGFDESPPKIPAQAELARGTPYFNVWDKVLDFPLKLN